MKQVSFILPTIEQVKFEIECLPEDSPIKGNASAIDEETDKQTEEMIINQLNDGNEWAWCTIKVIASYKGQEGTDYLGCCSYASGEDFKKDGYYEDMKQAAFNDLISQLEDLND